MRTVRLTMRVPRKAAADVYRTLADFGRYPELSDAVRSVDVVQVSADRAVSRWEVTFRAGLLRWTEEDHFDPAAATIRFQQVDGDIAAFDGSWQCTDLDGGTRIVFVATLDMGIPSLADALEPIAARALVDNTVSIVRGLMGAVEVTDVELAVPAGSAS
jgi:ribosome-associated toxin RatA of RatAB toxin-antitoxin module